MSGAHRHARAVLALCLASLPVLAHAASHAAPAQYMWRNVVVGGGGYSPDIIFSPRVKGLAYLRTDIGGLYRVDSQAARWVPLQDGLPQSGAFGIESIALDPVDDEVVYAAAGMYRSDPAAILRSTDRGAHWIVSPVTFQMGGNEDGRGMGERLAVDPNDHAILYFGSRHDGLQRSVDFGRSWSRAAGLPIDTTRADSRHGGVSFVMFDPRSSSLGQPSRRIYVGIANQGSAPLWCSQDAGEHWQALHVPVPNALLPMRAALDANGDLYVTFADGIGPNGITRGAVWRFGTDNHEFLDVTPTAQEGGYLGLSVDPRHPGTVLVASIDAWHGGDTIWRSTDRGAHWRSLRERAVMNVAATPFLDFGAARADFGWWMTGLAIDPFDSDHLIYTTGATVYASDSPLEGAAPLRIAPWVPGIEETAVLALAQSGRVLLSGFGDIGGFRHDDLGRSPPHMYENPVFTNTDQIVVASSAQERVVRSGRMHGDQIAAADSMDGGRTWQPVPLPAGLRSDCTELKHPRPPWLALSADASTLMAADCNAWISTDRGVHWREVAGLPIGAHPIADGRQAARFYAFAQDDWWVSDAGHRFHEAASSGLPRLGAADPNGGSHFNLYAVPGRAADLWLLAAGQAYHSNDGGTHFKHLASDLLFDQISFGKSASPASYPALFAIATKGAVHGVYRSTDGGASFERVTDGEHEYGGRYRVILADQRVIGRVYVGTDGRGLLVAELTP